MSLRVLLLSTVSVQSPRREDLGGIITYLCLNRLCLCLCLHSLPHCHHLSLTHAGVGRHRYPLLVHVGGHQHLSRLLLLLELLKPLLLHLRLQLVTDC